MLKTVLFIYILIITLLQGIDFIYLLFQSTSQIPTLVMVLTLLLTLFGIFLVIRHIMGKLKMVQLAIYFVCSTLIITFNLIYIYLTVVVALTIPEMIFTGSVLQIIVNLLALYYCGRHARERYISVHKDIEIGEESQND